MGGGPRSTPHPQAAPDDPVAIPRTTLTDHLADLDEVYDALDATGDAEARRKLDGVLCALHARVFAHLPDGETPPADDR